MELGKTYVEDHWLGAYAAGQLPVGLSLMVAAHLDMCPELRPRLEQYECLGGSMMEDLSPCPEIGYDMLSSLLNRIEEQESSFPDLKEPENLPKSRQRSEVFPRSIERFLGHGFEQARWRFAGPGSVISHLWQDDDKGRLWMFRSKGGTATPVHTHSGIEWTLILKGGYTTVEGNFREGDLHQVDETCEHQPIMDQGEDCVCLVFTEGPTIYSDFLPKIMQRFTGI